ncbi:MAG: hypothetical protein C4529_01250 [Deltaproteobacteria bacterium]|nr:MAG: hypothetical protein C4529_01250 [Deltaproteobacteria bacterium]
MACLLALMLSAATVGTASAELPAPNWMPGFPLLAGPQVILMWGPVPGAAKYNVYLDGKLIFKDQASFQATQAAPEAGGEHQFEVVAIDASGKEGARSRPGIIKIVMLEAPKDITLLPGEKQIQMRWNSASGAMVYDVFRREKGAKEFTLLGSVQETRYTDSNVDAKKLYEYALKSKDVTGKSSGYSKIAEGGLAVAASGPADKKMRVFALNAVPTDKLGTFRFDAFPSDIAVSATGIVAVSADILLLSEAGVNGPYRPLLDGEKGFNGVGIDPKGTRLYAANGVTGEVVVLSLPAGEPVSRFKVPPPKPGELSYEGGKFVRSNPPSLNDVAVDASGNIYVSDNPNYRLVKLGPDGAFLGTVGWEKGKEEWLVFWPTFVAVDGKGRKYVSSMTSVSVFGPDDKFIATVGGLGATVGDFGKVKGLATDKESRLIASDMQNGTVQVFEWNEEFRNFDPVGFLSRPDGKGNLAVSAPAGIALSPAGDVIYAIETIHKYASGFKVQWDKLKGLKK